MIGRKQNRGDHIPREMEWFNAHRQELLAEHRGKWAVVHKQKLIGVFDNFGTAYNEGIIRSHSEKILVHQILERDPILYCPTPSCNYLIYP